ncbi:MAG: hypothetical protein D6715_09695 [Calditrichaeota bacterium]|nr:MAG: hypothetical protein D6715_09695 [Calditrichota bacterium]
MRFPFTFLSFFAGLWLAFPLLAQEEALPPQPSPTNLQAQLADVVAASLLDSSLTIVLAEVPALSDLSQPTPHEELPENFLEILVELSLANLNRLENLRGQAEAGFYIVNVFPFEEASNYQGFLWEPGSRWLLFLENPLDSSHARFAEFQEAIVRLKAGSLLRPGNFFLLHRNGMAAVCLHWPQSAEKNELLVVAPEEVVADIRAMLNWLPRFRRDPEKVEPPETFRNRLKTPLGQQIFEYLLVQLEM